MTSNTSFRQTEKWKKGRKGELLIADLLKQAGWYILPSYDYSGEEEKAPRLQGALREYVIPDLDISKNGERRWAEVKTKQKADWTYITRRLEHGIPLRHYRHYLEVQEITGCDVWLFVYEIEAGDVLFAKLNDLADVLRLYEGNKMSRGGMAFFPRDAFRLWPLRSKIEKAHPGQLEFDL